MKGCRGKPGPRLIGGAGLPSKGQRVHVATGAHGIVAATWLQVESGRSRCCARHAQSEMP